MVGQIGILAMCVRRWNFSISRMRLKSTSFTEETWPCYQDAAVIIEAADGRKENGSFRWNEDMEGIDLLDARFT